MSPFREAADFPERDAADFPEPSTLVGVVDPLVAISPRGQSTKLHTPRASISAFANDETGRWVADESRDLVEIGADGVRRTLRLKRPACLLALTPEYVVALLASDLPGCASEAVVLDKKSAEEVARLKLKEMVLAATPIVDGDAVIVRIVTGGEAESSLGRVPFDGGRKELLEEGVSGVFPVRRAGPLITYVPQVGLEIRARSLKKNCWASGA